MPRNKGKKKYRTPEKRFLQYKDDMQEYAKITKSLGNRRLLVMFPDETEVLAHIPGRFRRKTWMAEGDIILVSRRDFQEDRVDIIHKYNPDEVRILIKEKEIPKTFISGKYETEKNDIVFEEENNPDVEIEDI